MNLQKWFLIAFFSLSINTDSRAQSSLMAVDAGDDRTAPIQARIDALLEENDSLESEYKLLFENAQSLNKAIEQCQAEIKPLEEQFNQNIKTKETEEKSSQELKKRSEEINTDLGDKKEKNGRLKSALLELDKEYKMLVTQFNGMQKEKTDLEKEIKFREFSFAQTARTESLEVKDLKASLSRLDQRERELLDASGKKKEMSPSPKNDLNKINQENKRLTKRMNELEEEVKKKKKELTESRNQNALSSRSAANLTWEKEKERVALAQDVKELQSQLDALNQTVNGYLTQQTKQEELLQGIMTLDEENKLLDQRISVLEEQREILQP